MGLPGDRDAAERRATATTLPPEQEGYELGAGLMSEAEIVFFSAHEHMKSYDITTAVEKKVGSSTNLVIGFALSGVLFVGGSWVASQAAIADGDFSGIATRARAAAAL